MNLQRIVRELKAFLEMNSYSQTRFSHLTGVPQPTISRALSNPVRLSKTHRKLCKFAGIRIEDQSEGATREVLVQAVLEVWDGTREHAHSIARLLRAGATLEAYGASRAVKSRKPHANR